MSHENYDVEAFNRKLNDWSASQGLFFQLMHGSSKSMVRLISALVLRIALVTAVVAGLLFLILTKRVNSDGYREGMVAKVQTSLAADEIKMPTFSRNNGRASIKSLTLVGSDDAFYHDLELYNFAADMPIQALIPGQDWQAGTISINECVIVLKAGADSDEEAQVNWNQLFTTATSFNYDGIRIKKGTLTWGYREASRGTLKDSEISLTRVNDETWSIIATGGLFQQSWIKAAQVSSITATLSKTQGLTIESAKFTLPKGGEVDLTAEVSVAALPEVTGTFEARKVVLAGVLPSIFENVIQGEVDASGTLGGSPNGNGGVSTTGRFNISEGSQVAVRNRVPLVATLNRLDQTESFRRILFDTGRFDLFLNANTAKFSNLKFIAENRLELMGEAEIRKPTMAETAEMLGLKLSEVEDLRLSLAPEVFEPKVINIGLREAASGGGGEDVTFNTDQFGTDEQMQNARIEATLSMRRFYPDMTLRLWRNSFSVSPHMLELYEIDPETREIIVPFAQDDPLAEATKSLSDMLTEQSVRTGTVDDFDGEIERLLQAPN